MRLGVFLIGLASSSLLSIGGVLLVRSWNVYQLARGTSPEPQVIRLRDLSDAGYGDNRHVKVTDCALGRGYVVFYREWSWVKVCIPLVPADDPGRARPGTRQVWVVLVSNRLLPESDLKSLLQQSSVQGVVSREASLVGLSEQRELQRLYPGLNWSNCLVLEEGRVPMKESTVFKILVASASMAVVGGLVFAPWCLFCLGPWLKGALARDRLLAAAARAERRARRPPAAPKSGQLSGPQPRQPAGEAIRPPLDDHVVEE
jgi:hypothetical protein